jgi:5-methyltetrahydrofolate--homocysteine methyltransferase
MQLTESLAMYPASSVSGFYFANPQASYFNLGPIGADQFQALLQYTGREEVELKRALSTVYDA